VVLTGDDREKREKSKGLEMYPPRLKGRKARGVRNPTRDVDLGA
jgi:hypothetical protein